LNTNIARTSSAPCGVGRNQVDAECRGHGVAASVVLTLIRVYKLLVSPYFAGSCRFMPSCADYARDAVIRHGAAKGAWLALRRLLRCHPLCEGGHDPVPQKS
jgi:uncharacterized protein